VVYSIVISVSPEGPTLVHTLAPVDLPMLTHVRLRARGYACGPVDNLCVTLWINLWITPGGGL